MTALVLDASAVVEYLRNTPAGARVGERMAPATLHIPHLCPVEVTSAFRGLALAKKIRIVRAAEALIDLADLPAMRHPVEPLLPRIWTLRANLTAYDAVYVALAEAVEAPLVTCDRKIAPKYAHHVQVEVID